MLLSLALILLVGLTFSGILNRLHIPGILGMLLAGILLGPYGLNRIAPEILVLSKELRALALIVILLRAGLSLDLQDLRQIGRSALWMTFVPATFELSAIVLLAPWLLGISLLDAAILGAVLAAVSPAVVIPRMLKLMDEGYGQTHKIPQLIMAGASVDDVYVIVLFSSFIAMAQGKGFSVAAFLEIPAAILTGVIGGALIGVTLIRFFKFFHMRDTVKVLVLLSTSFLFVAFENNYGSILPFSDYLAVMAMGAIILQKYGLLANRIAGKFAKGWVAAELLLFVLVGAAVDLSNLASIGPKVVLVLILALAVRMAGVFVSLLASDLTLKEKLFSAIAYLPKATVQAAIGSIPLSLGLPSGQLILSTAVLAILITAPLGAFGIDLTYKRLLESDTSPNP